MPKKRHRPEEILSKPREAGVPISQGKMVVEVIKALCATDVTWYRCRQEYGGVVRTPGQAPQEIPGRMEPSRRGVETAPRRTPTFLAVASCSAYPYRTYFPGDCSLAYSLYHYQAIPPNVDEDFMGKRAGDGKRCFDNIKAFRYPSHIAFCREPPARGGASREKTPFLSPFGFESLVVRVGPVSMDSASGTYIIKEVTGDSQEYKINPTCEATFVVPEAT